MMQEKGKQKKRKERMYGGKTNFKIFFTPTKIRRKTVCELFFFFF